MATRGFTLNGEVLHRDKRVEFSGTIWVRDTPWHLHIVYPDAFPSFPPHALTDASNTVLPRHHNPRWKALCLFGPMQIRWTAMRSGADAVGEAEDVITAFANGNVVPEDTVPEPVTAAYNYALDAAIVVPPSLATPLIPAEKAVTIGAFKIRFQRQVTPGVAAPFPGRGIVLETTIAGTKIGADESYKDWCKKEQGEPPKSGPLILLHEPPPYMETAADFDAWLDNLSVPSQARREWTACVFPEQMGVATNQRLAWLVVYRGRRGDTYFIRTFPLRPDEWTTRIPGMDGLAAKRVVVVGCGSVGSKIAVGLASTGVTKFSLIDSDVMEPYNSVRHEIGVGQYGAYKVVALAARIADMNPQAAVNTKGSVLHIGGINEQDAEKALFEFVSEADLVVETTGVHAVSRFINDICHDVKVPSLYATVTNGAWGGEVVRVIPGETACWNCWYQQYENDKPPAAPTDAIFAPGCDQPTFTGTTYDVGLLANIATSMVVETLLRHDANRHDVDGDYIRWSGRNADGSHCLRADMLGVRRRDICPLCDTP